MIDTQKTLKADPIEKINPQEPEHREQSNNAVEENEILTIFARQTGIEDFKMVQFLLDHMEDRESVEGVQIKFDANQCKRIQAAFSAAVKLIPEKEFREHEKVIEKVGVTITKRCNI